MIRYNLAAAALKAFSINGLTRAAYRQLGNVIGGRSRAAGIPASYIARADANLRFIEQNGAIADGQTVLEIGTGWVHWEAVFTRLFYDVELVAFDVWDNRQFGAFQSYMRELRDTLPDAVDRPAAAIAKAQSLIDRILICADFAGVYELLGIRYVIDAGGALDAIADTSVDLVISSDVLEHIPAHTLPRLAQSLNRILKPGGHFSHQIVEADHLVIYDPSAHRKSYLKFSESQWKMRFENSVQHMNRWQHSDYLKLFSDGGFAIEATEILETADTGSITIADRWSDYDKADLDICVSRILAKNTPKETA